MIYCSIMKDSHTLDSPFNCRWPTRPNCRTRFDCYFCSLFKSQSYKLSDPHLQDAHHVSFFFFCIIVLFAFAPASTRLLDKVRFDFDCQLKEIDFHCRVFFPAAHFPSLDSLLRNSFLFFNFIPSSTQWNWIKKQKK